MSLKKTGPDDEAPVGPTSLDLEPTEDSTLADSIAAGQEVDQADAGPGGDGSLLDTAVNTAAAQDANAMFAGDGVPTEDMQIDDMDPGGYSEYLDANIDQNSLQMPMSPEYQRVLKSIEAQTKHSDGDTEGSFGDSRTTQELLDASMGTGQDSVDALEILIQQRDHNFSESIMNPNAPELMKQSVSADYGGLAGSIAGAVTEAAQGTIAVMRQVNGIPVVGDAVGGITQGVLETSNTLLLLGDAAFDTGYVQLDTRELVWGPEGAEEDVNWSRDLLRGFAQYALPYGLAAKGIRATGAISMIRGGVNSAGRHAMGNRLLAHGLETGLGGMVAAFLAANPSEGNGMTLQMANYFGLDTSRIESLIGVSGDSEGNTGKMLLDKLFIALQDVPDGLLIDLGLTGLGRTAKGVKKGREALEGKALGGNKRRADAQRMVVAAVMARNTRANQLRSMGKFSREIEAQLEREGLGLSTLKGKYVIKAYAELAAPVYNSTPEQLEVLLKRATRAKGGGFSMSQFAVDTTGGTFAAIRNETASRQGTPPDPTVGRLSGETPATRIILTETEEAFLNSDMLHGERVEWEKAGVVVRASDGGERGHIEVHGDMRDLDKVIERINLWHFDETAAGRQAGVMPQSLSKGTFGHEPHRLLFQNGTQTRAEFKASKLKVAANEKEAKRLADQLINLEISEAGLPYAISVGNRVSALDKGTVTGLDLQRRAIEIRDNMLNEREDLFAAGAIKDATVETLADKLGRAWANGTDVRKDLNEDIVRFLKQQPEGNKYLDKKGGITEKNAAYKQLEARAVEWQKRYHQMATADRIPGHPDIGAPAYFGGQKWSGKVHKQELVNQLVQMSQEGVASRYWYEKSSTEIMKQVGGNKEDAEILAQLVAITSQQNDIKPNIDMAVIIFNAWKFGDPKLKANVDANGNGNNFFVDGQTIPVWGKMIQQDVKIQNLLVGKKPWDGRKTNSFYLNLMLNIDPQLVIRDPDIATIDIHMMRSLGYAADNPTGVQYSYAEKLLKDAADEINKRVGIVGPGMVTPYQVQAMVWTSQKWRRETVRPLDDMGILGPFELPKGKDYADIMTEQMAMSTYEAVPHPSGQTLNGLESSSWGVREQYTQDSERAFLDDNGRNMLFDVLGLPQGRMHEGNGANLNQMNPARQSEINMGRERRTTDSLSSAGSALKSAIKKGDERLVTNSDREVDRWYAQGDPNSKRVLGLALRVMQYAFRQEAISWHKPFYLTSGEKKAFEKMITTGKGKSAAIKAANGMDVNGLRFINSSIGGVDRIARELKDKFGEGFDQYLLLDTETGIRVVNFDANVDNIDLMLAVKEIIDNGEGTSWKRSTDSDFKGFKADSEYLSGLKQDGGKFDWAKDPEGRALLADIRKRGEPSLVNYVDNILGPRLQAVNEHYARQHNVGDAGRFVNSSGDGIDADTKWWDATGQANRGSEAGPSIVSTGAARGDVGGGAGPAAATGDVRPLRQASAVGGQRKLLADAGLLPERMYHVSDADRTISGLKTDKSGSGFLKDAEGNGEIYLYSPGHRMEPAVNSHYGPSAVHHEVDVSNMEIAVVGVKGVKDPRIEEMEVFRLDNPDATEADLAKMVGIDGIHHAGEGITTIFRDIDPGAIRATNPDRVPGSTLPPRMPMNGESNAVHDVTSFTASPDGVRNGMETTAGQTIHLQDPGPLGPKGWAEIDATSGFSFIGALEGADISTFSHEMGHSMHGQLIARGDPKMMQRLADAFQVEDYKVWSSDDMENFAESFEQWVMDPMRLIEAKREGIEYIGAVMRDIYRKMPEEARPREMKPAVREMMESLLKRTDLPFAYAPGRYMPAISWAAIHEEVKLRIAENEGVSIEDILEPGTIIATARGNLRKQMDPNNPDAAGHNFEELDLSEPDDFLRAIAAFDDLMRSMQDSEIAGMPRNMDEVKEDAREQFLNWMAAGDDDMREGIGQLMVSDARKPGQGARNVIAMNMLMRHHGETVLRLRDAAMADGSPVNYAMLDKAWMQMQFLRSQFLLIRYESGTSLAAWGADMKMPSYASLKDRKKAMDWMASMGRGESTGKDLIKHLRGLDIDDSRAVADQIGRHEKGLTTRLKEMVFEQYTAGLLSSARTFIGISTASPMIFQSLEGVGKAVGGLSMKGQRTRAMVDVARNAASNFTNIRNGLKYAYRAMMTEQPQFLSRQLLDTSYDHRAIRADNGPVWLTSLFDAIPFSRNREVRGSQAAANPVNVAGRAIRVPQTFIMTIDEFAKQVFGRTALRGEIRTRVVSNMIADARQSGSVPDRPMSYGEEKAFLKENKKSLNDKIDSEMKSSMSDGRLRTTRVRMDQLMKSEAFRVEQSWAKKADMISKELTAAEMHGKKSELKRVEERALRPVFQGDLPVPMQHFMKFMDSFSGGAPRVLLMPFIRTPYKIMEVFMQYEPVTLTYAQVSSRTKNFFDTRQSTGGKSPRTVFKKRWTRQPNSKLGAMHRKTMEDLNSNDPRRVAEARGRIMMAWGLTGLGVSLAMNEGEGVYTTGGGPSGKHGAALRKNVLGPMNWQANSVAVPQADGSIKYYQYAKGDPIGLHLSLCANIVELFQAEPEGDEAEKMSMFTSVAYSIMNTMLDRSYMKGMSDFIKMMTTSEETMEKWAIAQGMRLVTPWSVGGQDISRTMDPYQREAQSAIDEVRNSSWIGSQLLGPAPPKYNMLGELMYNTDGESSTLGVPDTYLNRINPARVSESKVDPVMNEMALCRYAWQPPSTIQYNHDLTTFPGPKSVKFEGEDVSAWTYYQMTLGKLKLDGRMFGLTGGKVTMREALAAYIVEGGEGHESYKMMSYEPDPEKGNRSMRVQYIQSIMSKFRETAKMRMLLACPEVRGGISRNKVRSLMIKKGVAEQIGDTSIVDRLNGQIKQWQEFETDTEGSGDLMGRIMMEATNSERNELQEMFPQ